MESIEKLIYDETKVRLEEMGGKDYIFPEKADKKDAIAIVSSIVVCVILIGLCMVGVIK